MSEAIEEIDCFGSRCAAIVAGDGPLGSPGEAAAAACARLLDWHHRFSRFLAGSELSLLNGDRRATVPVSPEMARLAEAICWAAAVTRGLVDGTLLAEVVAAGYDGQLSPGPPLALALELAPPRAPGGPALARAWQHLEVDLERSTVSRPPGLRLDSGGLAKGLFADMLAEQLSSHEAFALDCGGDIAFGGARPRPRRVRVESPFDGTVLHTFERRHGGVATSGIGRRSWLTAAGLPAHHLLDPASGRPVFSGVVQATALAPTALEAEVFAKAAVLSGPEQAQRWLRHGGVVVLEDGSYEVFEPAPEVALPNTVSLRLASSPPPSAKEAASASVISSAGSGGENR